MGAPPVDSGGCQVTRIVPGPTVVTVLVVPDGAVVTDLGTPGGVACGVPTDLAEGAEVPTRFRATTAIQ